MKTLVDSIAEVQDLLPTARIEKHSESWAEIFVGKTSLGCLYGVGTKGWELWNEKLINHLHRTYKRS